MTDDSRALGAPRSLVEAVREDDVVKREVLEALAAAAPEAAADRDHDLVAERSRRSRGRRPTRRGSSGCTSSTPVHECSLVELCFPDEADAETRERARTRFCAAIGKTAVEVPDEPGFVVNRLLFPYLFDAVRLLERTRHGARSSRRLHEARRPHPMGPLELLDFVGLDVADAIGEAIHADSGDPAHRPPGRIKQLVGEGRLGRKSGRGLLRVRLELLGRRWLRSPARRRALAARFAGAGGGLDRAPRSAPSCGRPCPRPRPPR